MSRIAPKPIVSQIVRTWDVPPAMSFAVVEDIEGRFWIEKSCPVGTHYWTVQQAAELPPAPAPGAPSKRPSRLRATACRSTVFQSSPPSTQRRSTRPPAARRIATTQDRRTRPRLIYLL